MVLQIILADILLVARIFARPCGARKNTTQLVKYPRVLSVKPSNKVYVMNKIENSKLVFEITPCKLGIAFIFIHKGAKQLFAEGEVNIAEYLPRRSRGKFTAIIIDP